jgi:ubiquinone/menaquinone biosynthesis C-methylase UbiE
MVEIEMERFKHYASPEGMKYLEEKKKQPPTQEEIEMMSEREGYDISASRGMSAGEDAPLSFEESGFAKARADVDWVDPSKRAK